MQKSILSYQWIQTEVLLLPNIFSTIGDFINNYYTKLRKKYPRNKGKSYILEDKKINYNTVWRINIGGSMRGQRASELYQQFHRSYFDVTGISTTQKSRKLYNEIISLWP